MQFTKALLLAAALCLSALILHAAPPTPAVPAAPVARKIDRQPDGLTLHLDAGDLRIQLLSDSIVRVAFARSADFFSRASLDVLPNPSLTSGWKLAERPASFVLTTAKLHVIVDRTSGAVSFTDAAGRPILSEAAGSRTLEPASVQGEDTFHIQQKWKAQPDESLYGLGQMQLGITDIKGYDLDLWQHNTNIVVPFLVSSRGYGILWDNTSFTRFGDLRPFVAIPPANLYDADGKPGGLTLAPIDSSQPPSQSPGIGIDMRRNRPPGGGRPAPLKAQRWQGSVLAPVTGDYQFQAYSNGGIKAWFDGKLVMDHWRQSWNPTNDQVLVHLLAGHKYPIKIENDPEQQSTLTFLWKTPPPTSDTSLWSQVGDGIDYTFVYGPSADQVIAGYRLLTGRATMLPNWVFGLWQSRQRYETADQSLDVVKQFRQRQIPFDNIVQDWQYWRADAWGSHQFDPTRFPDPVAWINSLHDLHAHLMISVWGKFNHNTDNAKEMNARGFLYQPNLTEHIRDWIGQPYTFYDAFNPDARKLFWSQIDTALFAKGIDAWWMDATEPDLCPRRPPSKASRPT